MGIKKVPTKNKETQGFDFPFLGFNLFIKDLDPGALFKANICACPQKKRETLLIKLMQANLIGQGTGGAVIGLDKQEKFLTLSLALAYELNYRAFKESLEDFINYLVFWNEEVIKLQKEAEGTFL